MGTGLESFQGKARREEAPIGGQILADSELQTRLYSDYPLNPRVRIITDVHASKS